MGCSCSGYLPQRRTRRAWSFWLCCAVAALGLDVRLPRPRFGRRHRDGRTCGAWLVIGTLTLTSAPGSTSRTLGFLLSLVAAALMVPTASATFGKVAAALVMFGAGARFALTAVYEFTGSTSWTHLWWWGLGLCLVALYAAMAFKVEEPAGVRSCRWAVGERDDEL